MTLSNPTGTVVTPTIATASATATIVDNDAATSIAISVAGGSLLIDESAGTVAFTVTRTGDAAGTQTVSYAIGGTVTADDLGGSLAGGTVTFAQGQTSQTITLTLTDDQLDELNETVTVTLSNPTGTVVTPTIATASATATIVDNDAATSIAISVAGDSLLIDESAGTVAFTVTRTGDAAGTQTVSYAIGGTVTGDDLGGSLAGGTVTFAQGQTSQTITLTLTDDQLDELNETVTVTLSNPTGTVVTPTIATASATATIVDNDAATALIMTFDGGSTSDDQRTYTENGLTISAVDAGDTLNFEVGTDRDLQLKSGPNNPYRIENPNGTLTLVSVDVIAKVGGSAGTWTAFKDLNNDGDHDDAGEQVSVSTDNVTGTFFFGDQFKNVDYVTFETVNDNPNANQSQTIDNLTFFLENQPEVITSATVLGGEVTFDALGGKRSPF